ncbi:hypothetical protein EJB05_29031, partial [Eragrostis curvula]
MQLYVLVTITVQFQRLASPSAGSCPQRLASRYIQRVRRSARARLIPGPLRSRILTSTLLSSSERPVLSACATAALCC